MYVYAPTEPFSDNIKNCLYYNFPEEVCEFLMFLKGVYSLDQISDRLYLLFKGKKGFSNKTESKKTTKNIYDTCKYYGFCN